MLSSLNLVPIDQIKQHLSENAEQLQWLSENVQQTPVQQFFSFHQERKLLPPLQKASSYHRFRQYQFVAKPIDEVFEFFSEAKNLERITPQQLSFKIESQSTEHIQQGTEFVYKLKIHGVPAKWKTVITNWDPPFQFVDYQEKGPYRVWFHNHMFIPTKEGTLLVDEVKFVLPFAAISNWLVAWFIKLDVKSIFKHRFEFIKEYYK